MNINKKHYIPPSSCFTAVSAPGKLTSAVPRVEDIWLDSTDA
ncbi:hypothetical protein E2C01_005695 [Portunus trituberculatus]|uniref:Uncharacterized protein n=1 Tax=Portunus trituberculatus TaxID=210409 RepID=A0A5B7CUY6_PORTR|nr:hypothetical protein [Portunus trituberculatus]